MPRFDPVQFHHLIGVALDLTGDLTAGIDPLNHKV